MVPEGRAVPSSRGQSVRLDSLSCQSKPPPRLVSSLQIERRPVLVRGDPLRRGVCVTCACVQVHVCMRVSDGAL